MNVDLTPILQALLTLLATLITARLVPWIAARTDAQRRELLSAAVRTLVYAAEQLYGSGMGAEKLAYVKRQLEARGFTVDDAEIEAQVRHLAGELTK